MPYEGEKTKDIILSPHPEVESNARLKDIPTLDNLAGFTYDKKGLSKTDSTVDTAYLIPMSVHNKIECRDWSFFLTLCQCLKIYRDDPTTKFTFLLSGSLETYNIAQDGDKTPYNKPEILQKALARDDLWFIDSYKAIAYFLKTYLQIDSAFSGRIITKIKLLTKEIDSKNQSTSEHEEIDSFPRETQNLYQQRKMLIDQALIAFNKLMETHGLPFEIIRYDTLLSRYQASVDKSKAEDSLVTDPFELFHDVFAVAEKNEAYTTSLRDPVGRKRTNVKEQYMKQTGEEPSKTTLKNVARSSWHYVFRETLEPAFAYTKLNPGRKIYFCYPGTKKSNLAFVKGFEIILEFIGEPADLISWTQIKFSLGSKFTNLTSKTKRLMIKGELGQHAPKKPRTANEARRRWSALHTPLRPSENKVLSKKDESSKSSKVKVVAHLDPNNLHDSGHRRTHSTPAPMKSVSTSTRRVHTLTASENPDVMSEPHESNPTRGKDTMPGEYNKRLEAKGKSVAHRLDEVKPTEISSSLSAEVRNKQSERFKDLVEAMTIGLVKGSDGSPPDPSTILTFLRAAEAFTAPKNTPKRASNPSSDTSPVHRLSHFAKTPRDATEGSVDGQTHFETPSPSQYGLVHSGGGK